MSANIIEKSATQKIEANLVDYANGYRTFDWTQAPIKLHGMPQGGINIAYEALDAHLASDTANKPALRWISKHNEVIEYTYQELAEQSSRFASALRSLACSPGARVFSLVGRLPELYIAALGTLKAGAVFTPLFSAFGAEPIRSRMELGEASVLLTTQKLYRKKVRSWWRELPHLTAIVLIDGDEDCEPGCHALKSLMEHGDPTFPCFQTQAEDMALLHFTSGTTGKPKGVIHVHQAVLQHELSAYYALDLHKSDVYWCTADPGWVTGTSYGIIAPLCLGVTLIIDEAEFDAIRWYQILQQHKVSVWYTAPTAIRMLMKMGDKITADYDFSSLRFLASVGEPLNPEAVIWSEMIFGMPFHDNWWQTETGAIMIGNYASQPVKPGSMGLPLPGIQAGVLQRNKLGEIEELSEPNQVGELGLKPGWPSMFRGYINQSEKYIKCFQNDWYLSGDLVRRDTDGYYWFIGRSDDLIKSAGHLIGPFEIESALMEHEAVAEAGVIGIPDPIIGEIVKAFVTVNAGFKPNEALRLTLLGHARQRLGGAVAPKDIVFRKNLPKTRSGKIMRRLLKQRELGLPEGDISTLESDEQ